MTKHRGRGRPPGSKNKMQHLVKQVLYDDEPVQSVPFVEEQPAQEPRQQEFLPTDNLLETSLQQEVESENSIKSMSRELFTRKEVEVKTEVSHNEINHISKLLFLEEKFLVSSVETLMDNFLALRISKQRKSRREFVESQQTEKRNEQGGGFMSKLLGKGGDST